MIQQAAGPFKMLGAGVYGVPEACRLADVPLRTATRWFSAPGRGHGAVLTRDYPRVGNRLAVSFLDLIDLRVVGALRHEGVSMQLIRRAQSALTKRLCTAHPFAHRRLYTDGRTLFVAADGEFEELFSHQRAFRTLLQEYLRQIEFDESSEIAIRWKVSPGVVVDPARCFGKPVLDSVNVPTRVLALALAANDQNADLVADLYSVTPDEVRQAAKFEQTLAA